MKLVNNSGNGLNHIVKEIENGKETSKTYFLPIGGNLDVPEEIANLWLKIKGVEKYVEPEDLEKLEAQAKEEKEKLEAENLKLKEELKKLKATKKASK